jgi:putative oxidoreductase
MSVPAILQKTARLGLRATTTLAFLAPLLTRITVGYAFFLTGRGKLANFATAQAPLLASLEYVGGICLVLGLLTRLMSLGLLGTMVGALVTAEGQSFIDSWSPTGDVGPLDIDPWVFLLLLSWLVLFGPGPLSLDRLASRFLKLGDSEAR